jgi:monomeric isocitrate dehydrogenase
MLPLKGVGVVETIHMKAIIMKVIHAIMKGTIIMKKAMYAIAFKQPML